MKCKNSVSLIGLVGQDATCYKSKQDETFCRFSLATSTGGFKKRDGTEVKEITQWHNIVCFGSLANLSTYIHKGDKIAVDGQIVSGKYTDKYGVSKNSVEIIARNVFLFSKKEAETTNVQQTQVQKTNEQPPISDSTDFTEIEEENLPF